MTPDEFKSQIIELLPRLRRFAMTLTRSAPDADDLLQEACARALQNWANYDMSQPLDRWLFRVVRNTWISEIRKRQVRQGEGLIPAEESHELQVEDGAEHRHDLQKVKSHIAKLPGYLTQPLLLVSLEGYSYRETSELLDIPMGTVMSRIHRARQMLASALSDNGVAIHD